MSFSIKNIVMLAALSVAPAALKAQVDFKIFDRDVQVHGFASQGFAYSNDNNYLTMNTSKGSFAMTDGGVNISSAITDKFRVGAQVYDRNVGDLGGWRPQLDWAFGDYKFTSWFGVRAGKVKTAIGLFNDTQDMEFLHTWAILPQAVYPLDLRSSLIAHIGGDVYGDIPLHKAGTLSYTAYAGRMPNDTRDGYYYGLADNQEPLTKSSGWTTGFDARWNTKIPGLIAGMSWGSFNVNSKGTYKSYKLPYTLDLPEHLLAYYSDYTVGRLRLSGEYRTHMIPYTFGVAGTTTNARGDSRQAFVSAAFRISKHLEVGAYNSRFYVLEPRTTDSPSNHLFDQVVTARVDINKYWDFKVEGHFMDGHADMYSARGFYQRDNQNGLKPTTNMLVVRTGFNF